MITMIEGYLDGVAKKPWRSGRGPDYENGRNIAVFAKGEGLELTAEAFGENRAAYDDFKKWWRYQNAF